MPPNVRLRPVANEVTDEQIREWALVGVVIHEVWAKAEEGEYAPWFQERRQWCEANLKGNFALDFLTFFCFLFDRADDAFAFKMRWG